MMHTEKYSTLKNKITLGYIIFIILAATAIVVLYQGIRQLYTIENAAVSPNNRLRDINHILTLVYEAESRSRSYFLFRQKKDFDEYLLIDQKLILAIDSLKKNSITDRQQTRYLDEIAELLIRKKGYIDQLIRFYHNNQPEISYQRALDEVYLNTFEIDKPAIVKENITIRHDSVFQIKDDKGFLGKIKKLFSSDVDSNARILTKTSFEKSIVYDTLFHRQSDSVLNTVKKALDHLRSRENYVRQQSLSRESELLHSDKIILDKIREIVSLLEDEEIRDASAQLSSTGMILKNANYSLIVLGGIAMVLILIFLFLIFRDISRNKAYQQALQTAGQRSEELLRLKEEFVSNMSHEVRTPLSAIVGFVEQLKKTNTNEIQAQFTDHIEKATNHLYSLVNNVLDISRSSAGKLVLDKSPFNFKEAISETSFAFLAEARRKNLDLRTSFGKSADCFINGDALRLKQVVMNILANAIKFTDKGVVTIEAEIASGEAQRPTAIIKISDTGIGIAKDQLPGIFDDFTQANSNITKKYGGSGLGLSISQRIVALMSGTIEAESSIGRGSTFTITFPVEKSTSPLLLHDKMPENTAIDPSTKILIVEDDETMRLLIHQIVKNHHLNAGFAENGTDALIKSATGEYNIVVTDIQMPGMNGHQLAREIRKNNPMPVIALTANTSLVNNNLGNDFDGFLHKPFREQEFIAKIAEVLHQNSTHRAQNTEKKTGQPPRPENKDLLYSLELIRGFAMNDPQSVHTIVEAFVKNTGIDLKEIEVMLHKNDLKNISLKIHKLLPMFRQLKINYLTDEMTMIEKYEELNLPVEDVKLFAEHFLHEALKVVNTIRDDFMQSPTGNKS